MVQLYNTHLCGRDSFDQAVLAYLIKIRSRKWYFPLFSWALNALLANSWRFYQQLVSFNAFLLDYTREIVMTLSGRCGGEHRQGGRQSKQYTSSSVCRYENISHWPNDSDVSGGVCAHC